MGVGFKHKTCCGPWKVGRATRCRSHSVLRRRVCLPWRQCTSATVLRRKCRGQRRGLGRRRRDTGSRSGRTPTSAAPSPPADAPARGSNSRLEFQKPELCMRLGLARGQHVWSKDPS
uniref:Uncharacterized protein n=1 Tax=Mustela putorius furo TaxID=9669 RepID=M3Z0D1_MUSPF